MQLATHVRTHARTHQPTHTVDIELEGWREEGWDQLARGWWEGGSKWRVGLNKGMERGRDRGLRNGASAGEGTEEGTKRGRGD